ncbi:hypothetical protein Hanom_Chr08g00717851 [Helianthus anomalus]
MNDSPNSLNTIRQGSCSSVSIGSLSNLEMDNVRTLTVGGNSSTAVATLMV